jgi:hypothetical protein
MDVRHGKEASDGTDGYDQRIQCLPGSIVEYGIVLIIIFCIDGIVIRSIQIHARENDEIDICFPGSIFHALADLKGVIIIQMTGKKADIQPVVRFHMPTPDL